MKPKNNKRKSVVIPPVDHTTEFKTLELIKGRVMRCFALYWWKTQISTALVKRQPAEIEMCNSCLQAVLVTVRDLDDFFSSSAKRFQTDLRANDFVGYASRGAFLSSIERDSINHFLIHLTYLSVGASKHPEWNTVNLVGRAVQNALDFMEFIECRLEKGYPKNVQESRLARKVITQALKNMKAYSALEEQNYGA